MMNMNLSSFACPESAVFFFRKTLDHARVLSCRVDLMPIPEEHRCGYRFSMELSSGESISTAAVEDVTSDYDTAEKLFELLSRGSVFPCHLLDVISDFLAGNGSAEE